MAPSAIKKVCPLEVLSAPGLSVSEYFGSASSGHKQLSVCLATVPAKAGEAHQLLEFDEYVVVVSGELWVAHGGQTAVVAQGEGLLLRAGDCVRWSWPKPCQYVIICLTAVASRGPQPVAVERPPSSARLGSRAALAASEAVSPALTRPLVTVSTQTSPPPVPPLAMAPPRSVARPPMAEILRRGAAAAPVARKAAEPPLTPRPRMGSCAPVPPHAAPVEVRDVPLGFKAGARHPSTQSMAPTEDPHASSEATGDTEGSGYTPQTSRSHQDSVGEPPHGFSVYERVQVAGGTPPTQLQGTVDLLEAAEVIEDRPVRYGARHLSTPLVIVASELDPFSKTGGLAMVTSAYAYEFAVRGHRTMVVSPRYADYAGCRQVGSAEIWLDGEQHEVRYFHRRQEFGPGRGCDYVFVDHYCFRRPAGLYGDPAKGGEYEDNLFRFALLSVAAAEAPLILTLGGSVYGQEVCFVVNDWQAALLPVFLLYKYKRNRTYRQARCILVLHNLAFQGKYRKSLFPIDQFLGLPLEAARELQGEDCDFGQDCINLLAAGIRLADQVLTVSPNHAREICTPEGGFGLQDLLREKGLSFRLAGILSGIADEWNPLTDPHIARRYGPKDFEDGKRPCKAALQRELGLFVDSSAVLIGFCGRLCYQKGVHLIMCIIPWLMRCDLGAGVGGRVQLVLMGKGEASYERQLREAESAHKGRVCGYVGFDPAVEHRMMAGCDLLLMPSQYEPCGLPQMYAQQYGTLPVAHQTGGLQDSVRGLFDEARDRRSATGFLFAGFTAQQLQGGLCKALHTYYHKREVFREMQVNAMQSHFYWPRAIDEYEKRIDFTMEDSACRY